MEILFKAAGAFGESAFVFFLREKKNSLQWGFSAHFVWPISVAASTVVSNGWCQRLCERSCASAGKRKGRNFRIQSFFPHLCSFFFLSILGFWAIPHKQWSSLANGSCKFCPGKVSGSSDSFKDSACLAVQNCWSLRWSHGSKLAVWEHSWRFRRKSKEVHSDMSFWNRFACRWKQNLLSWLHVQVFHQASHNWSLSIAFGP